jgi:hypothetical protein
MKSSIRSCGNFNFIFRCAILVFPGYFGMAGDPPKVTIIDTRHFSTVFGEVRNYRIVLPPGYLELPEKKYPVIYFFHGWSQRYFGSSNPYSDYDKGDQNGGDNIANFVARHDVIIVKADGYNRSPEEPYYVRPYNVSPVETYRQFPLYFPELVAHIDSHYRTLADRQHRGISGLSMGGFMTFWIGGKYPDLLSAAGNFCGSAEFLVGPKDFPVEYRNLDMYNNYGGMNVRLHYGDQDFIRGYHDDLNRVWPQVIDNYDFKMFHAAHSTCGMGEMFSFILNTFDHPPARPSKWGHIDVYPDFTIWGYEVMTDRTVPGFTNLEKVNAHGFRCSVREFLPDGELLPSVGISVKTAGIYEKNQDYTVNDINMTTSETIRKTIRSDAEGRLTITMNGDLHEIGINARGDNANLAIATIELEGSRWASTGSDVKLMVRIVNKGSSPARNVRATLTSTRPAARVIQGDVSFGDIAVNAVKAGNASLAFRVDADSIEIQKFNLTLRDDKKDEWIEPIVIPLRKPAPEISDFEIADGKAVTVTRSGIKEESVTLGKGNGDGVANPGEFIVILVRDQGKLWRTELMGSDPHVNPFGISVRESDDWTDMDHVGGSAKYDVPLVASDCPDNYPLEFHVEYWQPKYPFHIIRQGVVKLRVKGKDSTPPVIGSVIITGDNVLQARIRDGAAIRSVKAVLISRDDPSKKVESVLTDDGRDGDAAAHDLVFSRRIPDQVFGIFKVSIEAEDAFGNKSEEVVKPTFVLH